MFVDTFPPSQAAEIAAMAQDEKKAEGNDNKVCGVKHALCTSWAYIS